MHWAALLHDVGKLDVRPEILNKAGRPTDDEWQEIRRHPEASGRWLTGLAPWLGDWSRAASEHHERFDGDGYPNRLRGTEISLAGRIVAVADAFDVMTAARSYKKPYPATQARAELALNSGTQFDPKIVRAFMCVSLGRLRAIVGPLAWLSRLPELVSTLANGAATAAGVAGVTAAAILGPTTLGASAQPNDAPSVALVAAAAASPDAARTGALATSGPGDPTRETARGVSAPGVTSTTRGTASSTTTSPRNTTTSSPGGSAGGTTPASTAPTTAAPTTTMTTTAMNHAPDAVNDSPPIVLLGSQVVIDVLANDSDIDGNLDPSTLHVASYPPSSQYQSITLVGQSLRFVPRPLQLGTTSFTYQVCDTVGACANGTVTLTFVLSL